MYTKANEVAKKSEKIIKTERDDDESDGVISFLEKNNQQKEMEIMSNLENYFNTPPMNDDLVYYTITTKRGEEAIKLHKKNIFFMINFINS